MNWSDEEIKLCAKLYYNVPYLTSRVIATELNERFHSGKPVRTASAVRKFINREFADAGDDGNIPVGYGL